MSCIYKVLSLLDGFLCLFIFFPLAIFHWRGTWGLQELYFFPDNQVHSSWCSLTIGAIGGVILQFIQPYLFTCVPPHKRFRYYVVSRFYLYISGWIVMCYWRGLWDTTDYYLTEHWLNSVLIMCVAYAVTVLSRTSRNNVGLPFSVALDSDEDLLKCDSVFKVEANSPMKYFADVCFTQFVIVTANIAVWRGIWNVYDAFLLPENHFLSDVVSLVLGYALCTGLFLLQWPLGKISACLDDCPLVYKVVFEDVVMFAALWATLLLWRGAWDLCVAYVIPDPLVGDWISHWIGTLGLTFFQTFNVVAMNGIEKDGDLKNGEGLFPTSYLRLFFTEKKGAAMKVLEEEECLMETLNSSTNNNNSGDLIFTSGSDDDDLFLSSSYKNGGAANIPTSNLHSTTVATTGRKINTFKQNKYNIVINCSSAKSAYIEKQEQLLKQQDISNCHILSSQINHSAAKEKYSDKNRECINSVKINSVSVNNGSKKKKSKVHSSGNGYINLNRNSFSSVGSELDESA